MASRPTPSLLAKHAPTIRQHRTAGNALVSRSQLAWYGTKSLSWGSPGFYLLKEDSEIEEQLPNGPYDIPLMLHDRAFTADGELDYDHHGHHGATAASSW